jgi:PAS domain S-box-containing protein
MEVVPFDVVSALAFTAALVLTLRLRGVHIDATGRLFLAIAVAIYAFVGLSNVLEHAGISTVLDRYEDYAEILFPVVFTFFIFAARSHQEVEQRRRAEAVAATEKDRLLVTLESITDAVVATDVEGRVLFYNAAAERLLGHPRAQAIGRPLSTVVRLVDERTGEQRPDPVAPVLSSGQSPAVAHPPALVGEEGRYRIVEDSAAPIRDHTGALRGAVLVLRDVTERRSVQQELLKVQKLESLGVLAGGIAHDFNNIMTAILGNLSLARIYAGPTGKAATILDQAETATLRARDLTRQLLTFARGGAPVRRPRRVGPLVRETTTFLLRGSRVRCEFELPDDLAWIEADEGQLSQVVNNLVINAKEAMPTGGRLLVQGSNVTTVAGEVATLAAGRYVRLVIADEGPGMPASVLDRIFDPYFTTKERGSGLGLATAFSIIRQHDGYIMAESEVGRGTRMILYLPATDRRPEQAMADMAAGFLFNGRALLVDDEEVVREVGSNMLRELGLEVDAVADGTQALELYARAHKNGTPHEVVILDLTIPGGVGAKDALTRLRELDPNVRAVVATGYSSDPVVADHEQLGFAAVLVKPYRLEDLRGVLRAVLQPSVSGHRRVI